jgi:hypothetical protein
MEYKMKMQTVVELPSYLRAAGAIITEAERQDIVSMVAADPECGEVMQGTGGFRKIRVGRGGIGKRGGACRLYRPQRGFSRLPRHGVSEEREGQFVEERTQ